MTGGGQRRQRWGRRAAGAVLGLGLGVSVVAGCAAPVAPPGAGPAPGASSGTSSGTSPDPVSEAVSGASAPPAAPGTALAALERVAVKGRAPRTGYERDLFGSGWVDVDGNGCDTRNDVLARDLVDEAFVPGTRDCVVARGTLADPYSGTTIAFVRGQGTSELVQVDHVVALSDAWQKGAQAWDERARVAFANDPLNLLAVDGPLNMAKGDGDAATWLPPAAGYRCAYVARQVAVKVVHGVWMTAAEHDAVARVLAGCPEEPLPAAAGAAAGPGAPAAPGPAADAAYATCADVRAAGAAPISSGQPGFSPALDGDGDGVACEG